MEPALFAGKFEPLPEDKTLTPEMKSTKAACQGDCAVLKDHFRRVRVDETNAVHVGEVFRSAYGDDFPVKYVYQPESVVQEIHEGRLVATLAFDAEGVAAGYISVFKSAPNPRLWEAGNLVVVPAYKHSDLGLLLAEGYSDERLYPKAESDGLFNEGVCCHYFSQVSAIKTGGVDCALELDQLDGASFRDNRTGSARISCVFNFREYSDPPPQAYLPEVYAEIIREVALPLRPRVYSPSVAPLPASGTTRKEDQFYASAQTWKIAVWEIGSDWPTVVTKLLGEAQSRGVISLQITLNTACPHIGEAVRVLRAEGFFLAGLAPRWFGSDGLLMQQVFGAETEYDRTKLYSKTAKKLLTFIRNDRASVQADIK
ncbi:MAG: hypothetical protein PHI97_21785 [Desulfobulbus sp.]|nr:hypothetical protein [Desulfobulbus sp.]